VCARSRSLSAVIGISSKYLEEKEEEAEEDYIDAFGNKITPQDMTFLIRTVPGGFNCGRNFTLCCQTLGELSPCMSAIETAVEEAA
jgi:hypothetical protein